MSFKSFSREPSFGRGQSRRAAIGRCDPLWTGIEPTRIYEAAAARPETPTGWSADSEGDEFLKFLRAAFAPLGIRKSITALRDLYERAIGA